MAPFVLTRTQRQTLAAICDTVIPKLTAEQQEIICKRWPERDSDHLRVYCESTGSDLGCPAAAEKTLATHATEAQQKEMKLLLSIMSSRLGMLLLTGVPSPFAALSPQGRETALAGLKDSMFETKRKAFVGLKALIALHAFGRDTRSINPHNIGKDSNSVWEAFAYDGPAGHEKVAKQITVAGQVEFFYSMLNSTITQDTELTFDVVIVGSGCGGSVVAAELANVGRRVLVLEKGRYFRRCDISGVEAESLEEMYEAGGTLTTEDTGIAVLAGSAFGGGTLINWACSLRTPEIVKQEWAYKYGIKEFTDGTFDRSLDAVCSRAGVKEEGIMHNVNNQYLIDACDKLGYSWKVAPQNMADVVNTEGSGFIGFGDRFGNKKSTVETYLQDAAKARVPAKFADRCRVQQLIHKAGVAQGVLAKITGADGVSEYTLSVRAPVVVVAGGAINSPALLIRSGVPDPHRLIGKNLRLHPVLGASGVMRRESRPVCLWKGSPLTTVCDELEPGHLGDHYGCRLECPSAHPGIFAGMAPWPNGASFKNLLLDYNHSTVIIVLTRDKGSGEVRCDPKTGNAKLYYPIAEHDRKSLLDGLEYVLRMLETSGVEKIVIGQSDEPVLLPPLEEKEARAMKLEELIQNSKCIGLPLYKVPLFSAHQMGTCRMGSDPKTSVVKNTCETWGCSGLYVVDASTFPTSSGTNPMITTLAIAHMAAQRLKKQLGGILPSAL